MRILRELSAEESVFPTFSTSEEPVSEGVWRLWIVARSETLVKLNELREAWELPAGEYRNYVLLALLRDLGLASTREKLGSLRRLVEEVLMRKALSSPVVFKLPTFEVDILPEFVELSLIHI